jgi:FkbM family methyltransferase
MNLNLLMQRAAMRLGFYVVRRFRNPAYTLMGLGRYDFRTVLDVGANRGQFAQAMKPRFPRATFHCFEPTPAAFADLALWASTQTGVLPVQVALGEKRGALEMNLHLDHSTSSSFLRTTAHSERLYPFTSAQETLSVAIERLDDFVAALPTPLEDDILLKLDVQGYEAQVLRGAPIVLSRVRATIMEVSIDELYEGQSTFSELVALMNESRLRYAGNLNQEYAPDGRVIFLDAVFIRDGGDPKEASAG